MNTTMRLVCRSLAIFGLVTLLFMLSAVGCRREAVGSAPMQTTQPSSEPSRDQVAKLSRDLVLGSADTNSFSSIAFDLALCVDSEDRDKALMSIVALGHLGPAAKDAVPSLTRRLEKSRAKGEQAALINTLGKIGGDAKESLPVLRRKAKSLDPGMRALAQRAIANIE